MRHPVYEWAEGRGLLVKQVVGALGVSRAALLYWDERKTCPSPKHMKKIEAMTLGDVTASDCINYFLGESND